MTYVQNEYYQAPSVRTEIPEAFKSTMKSLEARIPNLHPKDRGRAEGILQNIRRWNRVTEAQHKEVVRLEKAGERKWKEPKPREMEWASRPGETPQETYDRRVSQISHFDYPGAPRYANKFQASRDEQRRQDYRRAKDELDRTIMGEDAWRETCLERRVASETASVRRERRWERQDFREGIRTYDRNRHLYFALPTIMQPDLIARPRLIELLRARRAWLLTDRDMQWHKVERNAHLVHVRRALASELLAHWSEIKTVRDGERDLALEAGEQP